MQFRIEGYVAHIAHFHGDQERGGSTCPTCGIVDIKQTEACQKPFQR